MTGMTWMWVGFAAVVTAILAADLGIFQRRSHEVKLREAVIMTLVLIAAALAFNVVILLWHGPKTAGEFLGTYLLEFSLSVDNLFVFLLIFSYFAVPRASQHKVLFWGILGALVLRGIFIASGVALLQRFEWIIVVFGALLLVSGYKMLRGKNEEIDPGRNPALRLARRFLPVTEGYEGSRFFVRRAGRLLATPLLLVLLVVETTDVVFAVDSIPAAFGVSRDPFIIFTSNVFAIIGLRSLFFALSGFIRSFQHLQYGLALVLMFVGVKMLIERLYEIPLGVALATVGGILLLSMITSLLSPSPAAPPGEVALTAAADAES